MKRIICAAAAALAITGPAVAQEYYTGQILLVGYNFCPRGTADASGQLLPISQNQALFSLYGTMFGGDGRTTFALPDLRSRAPIGQGQGPGLSDRRVGQTGGTETITQNANQLAPHSHNVTATPQGVTTPGSSPSPAANMPALSTTAAIYGTGSGVAMAPNSVTGTAATAGGGQAMQNMQPFLTMRYCVVLNGIYPSRN